MSVTELRFGSSLEAIVWPDETFDSLTKRLYPNDKFSQLAWGNRVAIGSLAHYCNVWVKTRQSIGDSLIYLVERPVPP